jgi:putative tryptophan/tyrosine transport system substrate-binding protein
MADMKRRDFIRLAGGMAAAWPLAARAQQAKRIPRIGILLFAKADLAVIDPCIRGLEALGYVDGKTVHLEYRDAGGNYGRFSELADELARLNSDVIFSFGGDIAPAIKKATTNIPIVVVVSNDPVESGLVASLARPGGNITGLTYVHDMLAGKSVELLKDTVPSVSRVAILWNPNHADPEFRETQRAARALGVQLQSLEVREPPDFEGAFQALARERPDGLIVIGSRLIAQAGTHPGRRAELVDGGRGTFDVWAQCGRDPAPRRDLHRQNPQRRQAERPADAAADRLRADHQRRGCQEARHYCAADRHRTR